MALAAAAALLAATGAATASPGVLTSWASGSGSGTAATVTTNAPVLRWDSGIVPGGPGLGQTAIVALRVNVTSDTAKPWSTGEVRSIVLPSWMGLAVYEGPGLEAGADFAWTAEERVVAFSNGTTPTSPAFAVAGRGSFTTADGLKTAREEAAAVMSAPNMSALWNGSWHSVNDRIMPSGFLPTSVSGAYGGITQMYVRDASGQIIGLVQCGTAQTKVAGKALRFMLAQLQENYAPDSYLSYAPHVMQGNKALDKIVSFDKIDQTDDTFYLIAAYGRYCEATGDAAMVRILIDFRLLCDCFATDSGSMLTHSGPISMVCSRTTRCTTCRRVRAAWARAGRAAWARAGRPTRRRRAAAYSTGTTASPCSGIQISNTAGSGHTGVFCYYYAFEVIRSKRPIFRPI